MTNASKVTKGTQARALSKVVRRDPPKIRLTPGVRNGAIAMTRSKAAASRTAAR